MVRQIRNTLRGAAKKSPALRLVLRKTMYICRRTIYKIRGLGVHEDNMTVVFEAYNGKGYACSPKAVYEYMLTDGRFKDYKFIWIFKEPEKHGELLINPRTRIVKYRSRECERALHEAKYWIFNYRALDHWIPKKGQVYVQCWHGTPLKRLGFDIRHSDNAMNSLDEIKDKYEKDAKRFKYLLSPCAFSTEKFTTAWNLKAYGKENCVLEIGYPRNDFLVNHTPEDILRIKEKLGFAGAKKKIILYAPTWRDNQHDSGIGYTYSCEADFDLLRERLGDEYIILFRAHYLVANSFDFGAYEGFVYNVSDVDDINELYVISDMLITDYSSVFFDYAILKRPILFYMYDLDAYRDELRGFYLSMDELPGKIVQSGEELAESIQKIFGAKEESLEKIPKEYRKKYVSFNERFNYLNDGRVSEILVSEIIKRNEPKIIISNIVKRTNIKQEKLRVTALCLFKTQNGKFDLSKISNIKACIGDYEYPMNFSFRRGVRFLKGFYLNKYTIGVNLSDLENLDIQNKINIVCDEFKGRILYSLFDFRKGKCRNSRIHAIGDTSVYLRQSIKNTMYLTVRAANQYDSIKGQLRVLTAYIVAKLYSKNNMILLFEKECQQYEESASVLYEKLIDEGYKNCYYILSEDAKAINKINDKYKRNIVFKDSFKHLVYFFKCKKFIGTETLGHAIQLRIANKYAVRKTQSKDISYVFLQHGVMYMISLDSDMRIGFRNVPHKLYRVVVSSELEAEHFIELGGFKREQLYVTGLAKFDKSYKYDDADKILVMLTWRRWEANQARIDFKQTKYYKMIQRIISGIPERYRDKVVVLPHPLMREAMLSSNSELNRFLKSYDSYDEALRECDTLITDYSSIAYDAFYRGSKVIFYWEEKDECLEQYGENAKLMLNEENAFGDVCWDINDVRRAIVVNYGANQRCEDYIEKYCTIVQFDDNKNTGRVIEALLKDNILR